MKQADYRVTGMENRGRTVVEELSATSYVILVGLLLIGAGFGLDRLGFYVESGIVSALAVVVLALAISGRAILWVLGKLE